MSSGQAPGGDSPRDARGGTQALTGWRHLQNALGGSLNASVKRSRRLAAAHLRRKG